MKDFDDIPNAVGVFPDVTAIDCSGPGEVDGTSIIADTMTDQFGWVQALLSEVGDTPSGSAETATVSQILNAIKLLPAVYSLPFTPLLIGTGWVFPGGNPWSLSSNANYGIFFGGILLPNVPLDLTIEVRITPGAARAGANRPSAQLFYTTTASDIPQSEIGPIYTDTGSSIQTITLSKNFTPVDSNSYVLKVTAGNDALSNIDIVHYVKITQNAQ
jgi:hypothetical protein